MRLGFDPDKVERWECAARGYMWSDLGGLEYPPGNLQYVKDTDFDALRERCAYLELENANLLRAAVDTGLRLRAERLRAEAKEAAIASTRS